MDPNITLRAAIAEFNTQNAKYFCDRDGSPLAQGFFAYHDVAHVVFGCSTSILGESNVKLWTIFGSTLGFWNHLRGYSEANAFSLFREYSAGHIFKNFLKILKATPLVIARARQMKKRWPWSSYEIYLNVSLKEIREEFGIRPL